MAFCERCGSGLDDEAKFCAKCGAEIAAGEENPYAPPKYSAIGRTEKRRESPWPYFIDAFKKYAVFKGRARRAEYWGFYLFEMISSTVFNVISTIPGYRVIVSIVYLLFCLGMIIPATSVMVRRMHDCNKSGWYMLIPIYGWPILCCTEGTRGPNYYGPDPKDENAGEEQEERERSE